ETKARFSSLGYQSSHNCYGKRVTSLRSYPGGAYYGTTAQGHIFVYNGVGEPQGTSPCGSEIVGMHIDIARMMIIAIANDPAAHLHYLRLDPEVPLADQFFFRRSKLDLHLDYSLCMSSSDGVCSLGGIKSFTSLYYDDRMHTSTRDLPSDALSLHHSSPDLVFAGLRSSLVLLEDLRVQSRMRCVVALAANRRAVIGVKRLKDSAVPWGLVVSAMDDQLLLFDVRFGKSPLIQFKGHKNICQYPLGLATSSDDEIIYAAGSDCRIRAWSTVTGDRIVSIHETARTTEWDAKPSPLLTVFPDKVQVLEVREDFGLDVAVDGWIERETKARFSSLGYQSSHNCYGKRVTSLRSYPGGAYYGTTAQGHIFVYNGVGEPQGTSPCGSEIVGMHIDIARMMIIAIANDPAAHLHYLRLDPEVPLADQFFFRRSKLDLHLDYSLCMSSSDGVCSLGGIKSFTSLYYDDRMHTSTRDLPSDALSLHHSSPDLVFAGLRSSLVLLEDLRVQSRMRCVVALAANRRAVIGVKRLKDSAVPWGLVVSAMDDQLLLFDVRFGKSPLIQFKGHKNICQYPLGLATSSDDEIIYAAGSDCRIRAWSTVTGDRIVSIHETARTTEWDAKPSPLLTVFPDKVQVLEVREDFGLDVAVDGWIERETKARFSSLGYQSSHNCYGNRVTSLRSYTGDAFYATTAQGHIFVYDGDGETQEISPCDSEVNPRDEVELNWQIVGIHIDVARRIMIAVAVGIEAHLHYFRLDPNLPEQMFLEHMGAGDLHIDDVLCMSSGDGVCSLGGIKSLTSLYYIDRLYTDIRDLPSDVLALHHSSPDLVLAGLSSSSVLLEDLRVQSTTPNVVASTVEGRPVIGVKRLKDSAVPWGLVVSAMDDQLLLFDVRFGKSPLIQFKGHKNFCQYPQGLTTSSDDEIVFAAGSDRRIRAWSTVTGDQIVSTHETARTSEWDERPNLLRMVFPDRVQALDVREDFGLDVAVDAEIDR
ncbi:MAG: hypothetical protein TREMPRED_005223, partial [Tremellales sp. Tagirdzhanova-0007]